MSSVRAGRDLYFEENGFSLDSYQQSTFAIRFLGVLLRIPNSRTRKAAVPFHDLHHVATGFGTDYIGEAEQGAWELGAGCRWPQAYFLNSMASIAGLFIDPRRVWRGFQHGRRGHSLYNQACEFPRDYDELLELPLTTLRERLGIPENGLAIHPRGVHADAPARTRNASASAARTFGA